MSKRNLTERFCASRACVPAFGKRVDHLDAQMPGLALRVDGTTGHKAFVLIKRYPSNPDCPTRRTLGEYGAMSLEEAREKARDWHRLIARGIDPKVEAARLRDEARRKEVHLFANVAERYLAEHAVPHLKKHREAQLIIEREFLPRWADRPIGEIRAEEISSVVGAMVKRGTPFQAHNAFGHLRSLFSWAIGVGQFGLVVSPTKMVVPSKLIGELPSRSRALNDDELRRVWWAADGLGYPGGPIVKLLILTGQRLNEIAGLKWSEIDLDAKLITIEASRMKGRKGRQRAHEVPLCDAAADILQSLPRGTRGDHVFSFSQGATPVTHFARIKARLDAASAVTDWVIHDLRRTTRSRFSPIKDVSDLVKELTIAHVKKDLIKVYDQHGYRTEKAELLQAWADRLRAILDEPAARSGTAATAAATLMPASPKKPIQRLAKGLAGPHRKPRPAARAAG